MELDGAKRAGRRRLMLLLLGALLSAIAGATLLTLLPICETESGNVSCLAGENLDVAMTAWAPALASLLALILARWRLPRIIALVVHVVPIVTSSTYLGLIFYSVPAVLQAASIFIPYRDDPLE